MMNSFQIMYWNSQALFLASSLVLLLPLYIQLHSCKLEQQESLTKNYGLSMSIAFYDELILWEQMLENPILPTYFVPLHFLDEVAFLCSHIFVLELKSKPSPNIQVLYFW